MPNWVLIGNILFNLAHIVSVRRDPAGITIFTAHGSHLLTGAQAEEAEDIFFTPKDELAPVTPKPPCKKHHWVNKDDGVFCRNCGVPYSE